MGISQKYWAKNHEAHNWDGDTLLNVHTRCPKVKLKDGIELSIQAGHGFYNGDDIYNLNGDYTHFDVAVTKNSLPANLKDGAQEFEPYKLTDYDHAFVYAPLPTSILDEFILAHGGIAAQYIGKD